MLLPVDPLWEVLKGWLKSEKALAINHKAVEAGQKFVEENVLVGAVSQPVSQPDGYAS